MPIDDNELNKIMRTQLPTPVAPACPHCGYNLTGLEDPLCPECGCRFDWRTVRRKARVQWLDAMGLKTMPEEIVFGFWLTCVGWGLAILTTVAYSLLVALHRLPFSLFVILIVLKMIEVCIALCGIFLCAHIVKFRNLPEEAREALRLEVPAAKAWVGLVAAVLLLPVSLAMCPMVPYWLG